MALGFLLFAASSLGSMQVIVSPAYKEPGGHFEDILALLSLTGIVNRDVPQLWLNSSSTSWVSGVPVMWPYPEADVHWLNYFKEQKNISFQVAADASLCTLFKYEAVKSAVKGVVMYEEESSLDALKWVAVSAAGIYDGIPVTPVMQQQHKCLATLPVVFTIPSAASFSDDLAVYAWAVTNLLPLASKKVLVGACHHWANYSCGWSDPLGVASIDFATTSKSMVINLSPDSSKHPEQAAMFATFAAHLQVLGVFTGWAEPESVMVELLSKKDGVVVCGAPNLSFFASLKVKTVKLPYHRSVTTLDKSKVYVTFQSNEGDTPKNAYSFRGGNWLLDARGSVPISWGSAPIIAELFPGLWEFYVSTSRQADQFFSATGGAGYAHPWSLPSPQPYFHKVADLNDRFMPQHAWVDVWEGGCPAPVTPLGENPCLPLYAAFANATSHTPGVVGGFSQWCSGCNHTSDPHYVFNAWLADGTPVFAQPASLWYPGDKGFCNRTDGGHGVRPSAASLRAEIECIEGILMAVVARNPQRPLFVAAYGVDNYVDVAREVASTMSEVRVVGAQDFAVLGRAAAPTSGG